MRHLGVFLGLFLSACTVELQHDLTEDDANDIYVLLQRNGIEAKKLKEEGGNEPKYIISVAKWMWPMPRSCSATTRCPARKPTAWGSSRR